MGKYCEVCGKGVVNTQKVRVLVNGVSKRMSVCTRCLRSNKVERAL